MCDLAHSDFGRPTTEHDWALIMTSMFPATETLNVLTLQQLDSGPYPTLPLSPLPFPPRNNRLPTAMMDQVSSPWPYPPPPPGSPPSALTPCPPRSDPVPPTAKWQTDPCLRCSTRGICTATFRTSVDLDAPWFSLLPLPRRVAFASPSPSEASESVSDSELSELEDDEIEALERESGDVMDVEEDEGCESDEEGESSSEEEHESAEEKEDGSENEWPEERDDPMDADYES